jgi:sulfide:quinone oxidoreductase
VQATDGRRVLIAGGGVAALEAALALRELAPRLALSLLAASPRWEYNPLSVAEPFGLGRAHRFELSEILGGGGIEIVIDTLEEVDAEGGRALTSGGLALGFDALLVAVGARKHSALAGAVTFTGAGAAGDVRRLLREAGAQDMEQIVFAVPSGVTWSLPAYELALMTGAHFAEREIPTRVALVSPERRPVEVFGERCSEAVAEMLEMRGVAFHSGSPLRINRGELIVEQGPPLLADAVVALARLLPPCVPGLPQGEGGFIPVDEHGRVPALDGVYAAGDATAFPLKQGGIASQQADAAAEAIAAYLGEDVLPRPFRPRLRGLLLTGRAPGYLRAEVIRAGNRPARSEAGWPPAKIAGRRLGPLLALHGAPGGAPPGSVALQLDASGHPAAERLSG